MDSIEDIFAPRDYLRNRQPDLFSDSVSEKVASVDRSMLDHQLGTLTNRGQETNFERFARRLAQRTICPNLLPQTGPTGGGDSKVDSETYPVAENLSLSWYVGASEASSERWAFAFSAKKAWISKVESDIKKIATTDRGYTKAFFISSQYVRDKLRAEVEDKLSTTYGLDVRILDRTWIIEQIFDKGYQGLAAEELGVGCFLPTTHEGPLDLQRTKALAELDERIKTYADEGNFGFPFVEDHIEAAILARGLDRPRAEVEGRLLAAERVASKYGSLHQQLVSAYNYAWTIFWGYEDYSAFAALYADAEKLTIGSLNPYHMELLSNLWAILHASVTSGNIDLSQAQLEARAATLSAELNRLASDDRKTVALDARTSLLRMKLVSAVPEEVDSVLQEVQDVVHQAEGTVGFPLEPLIALIKELGSHIGDREAYGKLFEAIVKIASEREGEVLAARMLLNRGAQRLEANDPFDAIRFIGRALSSLYKHESRHDLVRALGLCSVAYDRGDLFWAARGAALTACSIAISDFSTYGQINLLQAACYSQLKWSELKLLRLPQLFAWQKLDLSIRSILARRGYDGEDSVQSEMIFDGILGMRFLRADLGELSLLSSLPEVLRTLGLEWSAVALSFALGYQDGIPPDLAQDKSEEELYQFFVQWRDQPASNEILAELSLSDGPQTTLTSNILGCRIVVETENSSPCVELGESLLASLESLLSTADPSQFVAREAELNVVVPCGKHRRPAPGRPRRWQSRTA